MTALTTALTSSPSPESGTVTQDAPTALLGFGILILAVSTGAMMWTLGLLFGIDLIIYSCALIAIRSAVRDGGLTPTVPR